MHQSATLPLPPVTPLRAATGGGKSHEKSPQVTGTVVGPLEVCGRKNAASLPTIGVPVHRLDRATQAAAVHGGSRRDEPAGAGAGRDRWPGGGRGSDAVRRGASSLPVTRGQQHRFGHQGVRDTVPVGRKSIGQHGRYCELSAGRWRYRGLAAQVPRTGRGVATLSGAVVPSLAGCWKVRSGRVEPVSKPKGQCFWALRETAGWAVGASGPGTCTLQNPARRLQGRRGCRLDLGSVRSRCGMRRGSPELLPRGDVPPCPSNAGAAKKKSQNPLCHLSHRRPCLRSPKRVRERHCRRCKPRALATPV